MALWLRQSTAVTRKIGPFLDSTDGITAETGLTISQADVRLSKNGGAFAQKTESTSCTHDENGWYGCPLDTTDTGTLGLLQLSVQESGALPVWHDYIVVPANVYDSFFSTDKLQVDMTQCGGSTVAAGAIPNAAADAAGGLPVSDAGGLDLDAIGTGAARALTALPNAAADAAGGLPISDAGGLDLDAILADTNELQTDWVNGGRLDLLIDAILADTGTDGVVLAANAITAAKIATDAIAADEIAAAACNKIADHVIRRSFQNACDSANGDTKVFRSLLGAIAKLVNKISSDGSTLTVYEDDDTTSLGTQTITSDDTAEPVTALDTV